MPPPSAPKGEERKRRWLAEEDLQESLERDFLAYGELLDTVTSFKYLGRVMTAGDDTWTAVAGNLRKSKKSWVQMTRILGREGSYPNVSGLLFKAVIRAMFLFRSETWVLTPWMDQALGSFKHGVSQQLTGRQPRRRGDENILRWWQQWKKRALIRSGLYHKEAEYGCAIYCDATNSGPL